MRYKRVLLKLSGEALGEDNFAGAKRAAAEIKELCDAGLEIDDFDFSFIIGGELLLEF